MVDRPDVEVRQRTELTGTNRSCGLTTYISLRVELVTVRVAPGDGQDISNRALIETMLVIVSEHEK